MTNSAMTIKEMNILVSAAVVDEADELTGERVEVSLDEIVNKTELTKPQITGSMAGLKKKEWVTYADKKMALTDKGFEALKSVYDGETSVETGNDVADTTLPKIEPKEKVEVAKAAKKAETEDGKPKKRRGEKKEAAEAIFNEHYKKVPRKDIIEMFMTTVGLSAAGASTYYQNLKRVADAAAKSE